MATRRRVDLQAFAWCRSEACPREELHVADATCPMATFGVLEVPRPLGRPWSTTVREIAYEAIGERVVKTFRQVYDAVVADYGTVRERMVYEVLAQLREARQIAMIPVTPTRDAAGAAYVRYTSPLLWTPTGLASLRSQVADIWEAM